MVGEQARPSSIYKPGLFKQEDGTWVARYYDIEAEGTCIYYALAAFDKLFEQPINPYRGLY